MKPFARPLSALWQRFRWLSAGAIGGGRRTVTSRGLRFTLQCDNWITHYRWKTYNDKEPETLDWIDRSMRDGELLFDIGANTGLYTLYAALRFPRSRIVAFEPEYANLHLLKDNVLANGLRERVDVYSVGLSNVSGLSHLHIQDATPGSALHSEASGRLEQTLMGRSVIWREGIWTTTVDEFCKTKGHQPHCLKIDVDGTELKILEGARETLRQPMLRSVLIELAGSSAERNAARALLAEAGLRCVWEDPQRAISTEVWDRGTQMNHGA